MMNSFKESDMGFGYEQYKEIENAEKTASKDARSMSFDDLVVSVRLMEAQQHQLHQNFKSRNQIQKAEQLRIDTIDIFWKNQINPRGFSQEEGENLFSIRFKDINDAYNYKGNMKHKLMEIVLENGDSWENFLPALQEKFIGLDHLAWVNIKCPNGYSLKIGKINGEVQVSVTNPNGRWLGFRSPGLDEMPINLAKEGGMFEIVDPVDPEIQRKIKMARRIARALISADGKSDLQLKLSEHYDTLEGDYLDELRTDISNSLEIANHINLDKDTIVEICRSINPDPYIDDHIDYKRQNGKGEYTRVKLHTGEGILSAAELYAEGGILANEEHLIYKPIDYYVNENFISLYNLLGSRELFDYILSGQVVVSSVGHGNINSFIKMTQQSKTYAQIKENTQKISKNMLNFAFTSIRAIKDVNGASIDFGKTSSKLKQFNKNKRIDIKSTQKGRDYYNMITMVGRHIQKVYPGMGTTFVNLMSPLIETTSGNIPLSEWVNQKYRDSGINIWNIEYSQFHTAIGAETLYQEIDDIWLKQDQDSKARRNLALAMVSWLKTANTLNTPGGGGNLASVNNYLLNFNKFLTHPNRNFQRAKFNRIIVSPSLPEALALDRLTRWFSIPFELQYMANELFSKKAPSLKFIDMKGFIHETDGTFDKLLKFSDSSDYREQFMNWNTAQKHIRDPKYYLGDGIYIRSALLANQGYPLKRCVEFQTEWKTNKKTGLYYLTSKNSIRNKESVKSEFSYNDHPNDGKSWKTSGNERNGNQPITQRAKPNKRHMKSRLAVDYEYDSFPIGHPLNPFTNAFVIDFYGEIQYDLIKTAAGTLRPRVSYEDYIKYINGIKNKMLDVKKVDNFISHSKVLPDMPVAEFARLFNSHSQVNYYGTRAMKRMKGCWADTFIEFNNLGTLLRFQIEFLGTGDNIYKKVKQNDNKEGFSPEKMPTLYVCNSVAEKLAYLEDRDNIGFDSPILTKTEYFALMKAWWYAYAEMTKNGQDRSSFSFQLFITQLHAKAAEWNIDSDIALQVMGSFGYNENGNRFTGTGSDVFKWKYVKDGRPDNFKFEYRSADIALDFTTFLYLSGDPEMLSYIRFHLWKPTWAS